MSKRILSMLIVFFTLFTLVPSAALSANPVINDTSYDLVSEDIYDIYGEDENFADDEFYDDYYDAEDSVRQDITPYNILPENIAPMATAEANSIWPGNWPASAAIDGNPSTRWAADGGGRYTPNPVTLTLTFPHPVQVYQAGILPFADRITEFAIEYFAQGEWRQAFFHQGVVPGVTASPSLDNMSVFTFNPVTSSRIRLSITGFTQEPSIWEFQLFSPVPGLPAVIDAVPRSIITSAGGNVIFDIIGINFVPSDTIITAHIGNMQFPAVITGSNAANVTINLPSNLHGAYDILHHLTFVVDGELSDFAEYITVPAHNIPLEFRLRQLDLAYNRPTTASGGGNSNVAVNHNTLQHWTSTASPLWLHVDLGLLPEGERHYFDTVFMRFHYPHSFNRIYIEVSDETGNNPTAWRPVWFHGTPNNIHMAELDEPVSTARHIRLRGTRRAGLTPGLILFQVYNASEVSPHLRDAVRNQPVSHHLPSPPEVNAQIVAPNPDGTLTFNTYMTHDINENPLDGNIIPDFSRVGFRSGDIDIPFVDIYVHRLYPNPFGNDDSARIQAAIEHVGSRPVTDENGFRGVVELAPGTFNISGRNGLELNRSGVVLRGSGQGQDGTILNYTIRPMTTPGINYGWLQSHPIVIGNQAANAITFSNRTHVAPGFYPVGSDRLTVAYTSGFNAGDRILIRRNPTQAWVDFIVRTASLPGWNQQTTNNPHERVISGIDGNEIIFFPPLVHSLNVPLEALPYVELIGETNRVINVGVENMRIVSNPYFGADGSMVENNSGDGILVTGTRDGFVRDVTLTYFGVSSIAVNDRTSNFSVINNTLLTPFGQIIGGRRSGFTINGSSVLLDGNYARFQRYAHQAGGNVPGPIVFLDLLAEDSQHNHGPQTHHRWSSGILFDNINLVGGGRLQSNDRRWDGQGWSGGTTVFWNPRASWLDIGQPPTTRNFALGLGGLYGDNPFRIQGGNALVNSLRSRFGNVHQEAVHNRVYPGSLYRAQVAYFRTGDYRNAIPGRPVLMRPIHDTGVPQVFTITGAHDRYATSVTVYANGVLLGEAVLGNESNHFEFEFTANLPPGYHAISSRQVVRGNQSAFTGLRTINVRNADGSHNPTPSTFVYSSQTAASQNMVSVPAHSTLVSIGAVQDVIDLPNRISYDSLSVRLPESVRITTTDGVRHFNLLGFIDWDITNISYNPDSLAAQTFSITGNINLLSGVHNANDISTQITINVSVLAHVAVTGIDASTLRGMSNTPLRLFGNAVPSNASQQTIVWRMADGETAADVALTASGLITANRPGSFDVIATIIDGIGIGSNFEQRFTITFVPSLESIRQTTNLARAVPNQAFPLAIAHSQHPNFPTSRLNDGVFAPADNNTRWSSEVPGSGANLHVWAGIDFGIQTSFDTFVITEWQTRTGDFVIEYAVNLPENPNNNGSLSSAGWNTAYTGRGIGPSRVIFLGEPITARYVRIRTTSSNGGAPGFTEIEVYLVNIPSVPPTAEEIRQTTNFALSVTGQPFPLAIAHSQHPNFPTSRLNDGVFAPADNNTRWSSTVPGSGANLHVWAGIDFGRPIPLDALIITEWQTRTVDFVIEYARSLPANPNNNESLSSEGWNTAYVGRGLGPSRVILLDEPIVARYVRIRTTSSNGGAPGFTEIEVYLISEPPSPPTAEEIRQTTNLARAAANQSFPIAVAHSQHPNFPTSRLNDGVFAPADNNTRWSSTVPGSGANLHVWAGIDFGEPTVLDALIITEWQTRTVDFVIEYAVSLSANPNNNQSLSPEGWNTAYVGRGLGPSRVILLDEPITARYVRIRTTSSNGGAPGFTEIEVYLVN